MGAFTRRAAAVAALAALAGETAPVGAAPAAAAAAEAAAAVPTRIILAHAPECSDERDDEAILSSFTFPEGGGAEPLPLRRRLEGAALDSAREALSLAYFRLKGERWQSTLAAGRRALGAKMAAAAGADEGGILAAEGAPGFPTAGDAHSGGAGGGKTIGGGDRGAGGKGAGGSFTAVAGGPGDGIAASGVAGGGGDGLRHLSSLDTDLEKRRDRIVALLEVGVNIQAIAASAGNRTALAQSYKPVDSTYLARLQMDVLEGPEPGAMLSVAEQLPCLAAPPELDHFKELSQAGPAPAPAADGAPVYPDDLRRSTEAGVAHQWALLGPNTTPAEPFGADVATAWADVTAASAPHIVIGVVDTGCSMHPDYEENMCKQGDDCEGYDFGDDDDNPFDEPLTTVHGTMVTSIIAARPNNRFGIAGVCWGCRIMCLKVYNSARSTIELSSILAAYNYLLEKKVKLSNHSYISFGWSNMEYRALQALEAAGHLFVAASGNFACDLDSLRPDGTTGCIRNGRDYGMAAPASYPLESIFTVGSITRGGEMSDFSDWGAVSVDVMAPGTDAIALFNTAEFGTSTVGRVQGTSFSCPLVVGVAALVWRTNPQLTALEVKKIIMDAALRLASLRGRSVSEGTVDARAAVAAAVARGGARDTAQPRSPTPTQDNTLRFYGQDATEATEDSAAAAPFSRAQFAALLAAALVLTAGAAGRF